MCRKEREWRFELVEEEERLSCPCMGCQPSTVEKGKSGLEEGEMPGSHDFLYYRTEILSHPDLRLMSQHHFG